MCLRRKNKNKIVDKCPLDIVFYFWQKSMSLNIKVWPKWRVYDSVILLTWMKEMSLTKYVTVLMSMISFLIKSFKRPGVATMISTPFWTSLICCLRSPPPYTHTLDQSKNKPILYYINTYHYTKVGLFLKTNIMIILSITT